MRSILRLAVIMVLLASCDEQRVFEKNFDFNRRYWPVNEKPEFEFEITDTLTRYNVYSNVRNSLEYPYANIFLTYYLRDSAGVLLDKNLVRHLLFDEKTGEPQGESGLGDLYDHRIPLKTNHRFPYSGRYTIALEHYMRSDTLNGIVAVGLRVERSSAAE